MDRNGSRKVVQVIRQPTSMQQAYAWHRAALAGENPPIRDGDPHPGYYKRRLIKGGPWVPVRIFIDRETCPLTGELTRDEVYRIEVEGIVSDDPYAPYDMWTWLTPITREEFDHLTDMRLRDPRFFDARQKIDLSDAPSPPPGH